MNDDLPLIEGYECRYTKLSMAKLYKSDPVEAMLMLWWFIKVCPDMYEGTCKK